MTDTHITVSGDTIGVEHLVLTDSAHDHLHLRTRATIRPQALIGSNRAWLRPMSRFGASSTWPKERKFCSICSLVEHPVPAPGGHALVAG